MLAPALDTVRLFLHVLAATVWVGGQLTLAGLVPAARQASPEAPRALAKAFARLAWPAYGLLVATGLWNLAALPPAHQSSAWQAVLGVKLAIVALAGIAALAHQRATRPAALAAWGAVSGLASTGALLCGVLLAG